MKVYKKDITVDNGSFNALEDRALQDACMNDYKYDTNNRFIIFDTGSKLNTTMTGNQIIVETGKALISGCIFNNDVVTTITPDRPTSGTAKCCMVLTVDLEGEVGKKQYFEDLIGTSTALPAVTREDLTEPYGTKHQEMLATYTIDANGFITDFVDKTSLYVQSKITAQNSQFVASVDYSGSGDFQYKNTAGTIIDTVPKIISENRASLRIADFSAAHEHGEYNHIVVSKEDAVRQLFISFNGVPFMHVTAGSNNYAVAISVSDRDLKENITYHTEESLQDRSFSDDILQMKPVSYDWKPVEYPQGEETVTVDWGHVEVGFLAQDLKAINPTFAIEVENGATHINYESITNSLILLVQEQQKRIEALEAKII
jgi:Chaperone of endosialidase